MSARNLYGALVTLAIVSGCDEDAIQALPRAGGLDASVPDVVDAGQPCAIAGSPRSFASTDDVRSRLVGTWRACDGVKVAHSPLDTEGIALTDENVHFLHPTPTGDLDGRPDFQANGALDVEGHGPWQVVFRVDFTTTTLDVHVSENGSVLVLDDVTRDVSSTFVRVR